MRVELDALSEALAGQWHDLRTWVIGLDADEDLLASDSALPGWSISDLIAHIGLGISGLCHVEVIDDPRRPVASLAEYIALYSKRADDITKSTHEAVTSFGADILAEVDRLGGQALAALETLRAQAADGHLLVHSAHGTLQLRDYVATRLLELVVHSDDLDRSLPETPSSPVNPHALRLAAEELLDIVITRGGWSLEVANALTWVRMASGRLSVDSTAITTALRPTYTSDSVPDLGVMLPLL